MRPKTGRTGGQNPCATPLPPCGVRNAHLNGRLRLPPDAAGGPAMLFPPPWFFPPAPLFRGAPFSAEHGRGKNPSRVATARLLFVESDAALRVAGCHSAALALAPSAPPGRVALVGYGAAAPAVTTAPPLHGVRSLTLSQTSPLAPCAPEAGTGALVLQRPAGFARKNACKTRPGSSPRTLPAARVNPGTRQEHPLILPISPLSSPVSAREHLGTISLRARVRSNPQRVLQYHSLPG